MTADHVERTRVAYGDSAERYAASVGTTISDDFEAPIDRAMLETFAELAGQRSGRVIDAGCGTGRVARFLADRGLDVIGVDVAPGMVDQARLAHPDITFAVGELTDLGGVGSQAAAVAFWYSIITTPPGSLAEVWAELARVLVPGGVALVAFQCGAGEAVERPQAYGTDADLTLYRHDLDEVCSGLGSAGLQIHTPVRRRPCFEHETTDQAVVLAVAPE